MLLREIIELKHKFGGEHLHAEQCNYRQTAKSQSKSVIDGKYVGRNLKSISGVGSRCQSLFRKVPVFGMRHGLVIPDQLNICKVCRNGRDRGNVESSSKRSRRFDNEAVTQIRT